MILAWYNSMHTHVHNRLTDESPRVNKKGRMVFFFSSSFIAVLLCINATHQNQQWSNTISHSSIESQVIFFFFSIKSTHLLYWNAVNVLYMVVIDVVLLFAVIVFLAKNSIEIRDGERETAIQREWVRDRERAKKEEYISEEKTQSIHVSINSRLYARARSIRIWASTRCMCMFLFYFSKEIWLLFSCITSATVLSNLIASEQFSIVFFCIELLCTMKICE